jgi:hypothetical protein
LGLNHLRGIEGLDPAILSAAPMLSLRNVLRWDSARNAYAASVSLQMAVTTLLSADLHLDQDIIAVNIPLLFDHSITMDPRRLGSEWDSSIPGSMLAPGIIDDAMFYYMYSSIFDRREEVDIAAFISSLAALAANTGFYYEGRGSEIAEDVFLLTVPASYANASANILLPGGINFVEDLDITMFTGRNRLAGMDFEARADIGSPSHILLRGQIRFPDTGRAEFAFQSFEEAYGYLETLDGYLSLDDTTGNQTISFTVDAEGHGDLSTEPRPNYSAGAEGTIRLFPEAWRAEADFSRLSIAIPGADLSLNLRYMVMPDNEPVIFDAEGARLLTDLNIFDLLGMYARIEGSPLGGIIGDFLQ